MSYSNRPFGGSDPYDANDPYQDMGTDAPHSDADALDAWLNRIAPHSGSPDTRSGSGQRRPDVRIDDHNATGETASIIETAARFHQRIDEAQSRDARAAQPDPQLWETIMEHIGASGSPPPSETQATTANPWAAQPDTRPSRQPRPQRRPHARISPQQRIWNTVANIGLVVAILLAGFGVWRLSGGPGLPSGSNDDDAPTVPGFAMEASPPAESPATTEPDDMAAPPVSTPTPTTDCGFSADIPIFNGVDESPWDGTAVLLTPSGDVVLTCPEEPIGTVLAQTSRYGSVVPLVWPATVLIPSYGEKPEEARTRVVSLVTGEVVEFGLDVQNLDVQTMTMSPWLAGPAPDNTSDSQLMDLRTMQTRLLSEIAGTGLPEHGGYLTSDNGAGGTLVFGLRSHHTTEGNGTLVTNSDLPGDLLVFHGTLSAATWISVPEDFPPVLDIAISPDGTHVALHGATNQMSQDREDVFSILRLRDGTEVERSTSFSSTLESGEGVWVQAGKAYAYINDNALVLLPIDPNSPEYTVFETDGPLTRLHNTTDQGTVLVEERWTDDLATMVANEQTPQIFSVDIGTGEAMLISGVDVSENVGWWSPPDRFLVTFDPTEDQGDTTTYQVIDAVTGQTVGTLDDVPLNDDGYEGYPHLGPSSVASSPDGNAEIIAFDSQHIYLMRLVDGQYRIDHLSAPEGILAETPRSPSILFSPNGSLATMSDGGDGRGTVHVLDLEASSPTWQPGWEGQMLPFVPGTAVRGERPDWAAEIEARYDFKEVPDGTEFLNHEQLAETLRETEDNFYWPEGYDPNVEAMISHGGRDGLFQDGMAYTMLGGYNTCAWSQTWLDAFESGDEATAAKGLWIMTEIFPTMPNQDWSVVEWQLEAAALAAEGDPAMVQQHVTVGCQGLFWE